MQKNPVSRANLVAEEVPGPGCGDGHVVIANRYSLISAGTETASVKRNMKDMVVKAMKDPELRQSVKDMVFKDGLRKTADRVHYETTKWTPMGYSGAGVAFEVGRDVEGIAEGDLVAYGGEGHAEYIRAAKNLCVNVPDRVSAREAAFVAVGSIALQAVRRAEIQVGEVAAVLGLGLVGQLVSQLLQASGARVLGSDVIPERLDLAESLGVERAYRAGDAVSQEIVRNTGGVGVDHVLICAAAAGNQIMEQAAAMARDRARVTVVGIVNMDLPRQDFYHKELDLVMSRSYGPGRYDAQYEQHGVDYPLGYVRWTEKRNMQEFLRLIQAGKVNVDRLITDEFDLAAAAAAYARLMDKPDQCLGILLHYDETSESPPRRVAVRPTSPVVGPNGDTAGVAVAGCGSFARQFHLPNIKANPHLRLRTLAASTGQSAKEMAVRYGAENCTTDIQTAIDDPAVDAVMIFTRDNTHAGMTAAALEAGKHVFCEKPLATTYEECRRIADVSPADGPLCMVGFNRRFAPLMRKVKETLVSCAEPKMVHYRVNAGPLPKDRWVFDPNYAAGRVVGEVCHFVDLMTWLIDAEPVAVTAHTAGGSASLVEMEDVSASFEFADGSVGTILYTAFGTSAFPKERMEVFAGGSAVAMDDFRTLTIRGGRRVNAQNRRGDKGHDAEMRHFARAILGKEPADITQIDGIRATVCCLKIFESVNTRQRMEIDMGEWL